MHMHMIIEHLCRKRRTDRTEKRNRKPTIASGYFKTSITRVGRTSRLKICVDREDVYNTINQHDKTDRVVNLTIGKNIFFSPAHG